MSVMTDPNLSKSERQKATPKLSKSERRRAVLMDVAICACEGDKQAAAMLLGNSFNALGGKTLNRAAASGPRGLKDAANLLFDFVAVNIGPKQELNNLFPEFALQSKLLDIVP